MPDEKAFLSQAASILQAIFPGSQVSADLQLDIGQRADLRLQAADGHFVIEVKATQSTRLSDLEGRLAATTLQVFRIADQTGARPIVMIDLPKLGPKALRFAADFMAQNAPRVGWCLFDSAGAFKFEMPILGLSMSGPPRAEHKARALPARESLFSDLNRWMLKILLMREVPSNLWGGRTDAVRSAKDLRTIANVSTEKAYSFLRAFVGAGYVRETNAGLVVVRRAELVRTWLNHELAFRTESVPVRSIFGPTVDLAQTVLRGNGPSRFAVTGFEACHRLGVLHAPIPRKEVCIHGDIEQAIDSWQLHKCEARDADFFILKMPSPKSILRGAVRMNGLPIVDVLEAALAVFGQVPRGAEQAGFIFTEVLHWDGCA